MLPIYVSYFAGGEEDNNRKVIKNACGFIIGFTLVFVLLGALAGSLGRLLNQYKMIVDIVTGLVVVTFGLHFLGVFRLDIFKGINAKPNQASGFFSSLLFGIVFSVGWTPCVGAFLGSALMLAASQGHVLEGILMLFLYSLGLGIPFFISALLIDKLRGAFAVIKKNYKIINVVSGTLLVIMGILMATGLFTRLLSALS